MTHSLKAARRFAVLSQISEAPATAMERRQGGTGPQMRLGTSSGLVAAPIAQPRERSGKGAGFLRRRGDEGCIEPARERRQRQRELLGHSFADIDRLADDRLECDIVL